VEIVFSSVNKCRVCGSCTFETLFDFQSMPVLAEPVPQGCIVESGPLTVYKCKDCGYVFLKEVVDGSIYSEYIYSPQASDEVVAYLKQFVIDTMTQLDLRPGQSGLEIGSGDGSLCREFNNAGMDFSGVEPSKTLSKISREKNQVNTYNGFMNCELAENLGPKFNLVVVRHVLEHINNFESFFKAIDKCLAPGGALVIEVPYLGDICKQNQFYAFFFEHLSYFSVTSLQNLLTRFGFFITKAEFVSPEGGSVLIHASRNFATPPKERPDYQSISLDLLKQAFLSFKSKYAELIRKAGRIAVYGAGQRGVTLLNLMNASNNNVTAIYDENPNYHGLLTPQSHIPVKSPVQMSDPNVPDVILILASSYDKQIRQKYNYTAKRFVSLSELL